MRKAYKELVDDILPKFAESIDQNSKSLDNIEEFIYKLHSQGINVRYAISFLILLLLLYRLALFITLRIPFPFINNC